MSTQEALEAIGPSQVYHDDGTFYSEPKSRGTWESGPWDDEPHKVVWIDEATDLDCMIVRGPSGALCGYVGVGPDHEFHGLSYTAKTDECDCSEEIEWDDDCYEHRISGVLSVHGGLTFASSCDEEGPEATSICHIPQPGRSDDMWWFGFDCAHAFDYTPAFSGMGEIFKINEHETYRDLPYVIEEVQSLAAQLKEYE